MLYLFKCFFFLLLLVEADRHYIMWQNRNPQKDTKHKWGNKAIAKKCDTLRHAYKLPHAFFWNWTLSVIKSPSWLLHCIMWTLLVRTQRLYFCQESDTHLNITHKLSSNKWIISLPVHRCSLFPFFVYSIIYNHDAGVRAGLVLADVSIWLILMSKQRWQCIASFKWNVIYEHNQLCKADLGVINFSQRLWPSLHIYC